MSRKTADNAQRVLAAYSLLLTLYCLLLTPYSLLLTAKVVPSENRHVSSVSGQIALHPETNEIVDDNIQKQTKQVLENIGAVLKAAGSNFQNILKTTVFLKDMNDFGAMNEIYQSYFSTNSPARSTVEVSRLPKDVLVEIECVAEIPT